MAWSWGGAFEGLLRAGASDATRKQMDDFVQNKRDADQARATLEYLLPAAQQAGVALPAGIEKSPGASTSQLKGYIAALTMGMADKHRAEQERLQQEQNNIQANHYATQLAMQERNQRYAMNQDAATQQFFQNLTSAPMPMNAQGRIAYALENAGGPVGSEALKYAMSGLDQNLLNAETFQDPKTGARFVMRGNTMLPSGYDPSVLQSALQPVPGYTPAVTGRGGVTYLRTPGELTAQQEAEIYQKAMLNLDKDTTLPPEAKASLKATYQQRLEQLLNNAKQSSAGGVQHDYELRDGKIVKRAP